MGEGVCFRHIFFSTTPCDRSPEIVFRAVSSVLRALVRACPGLFLKALILVQPSLLANYFQSSFLRLSRSGHQFMKFVHQWFGYARNPADDEDDDIVWCLKHASNRKRFCTIGRYYTCGTAFLRHYLFGRCSTS